MEIFVWSVQKQTATRIFHNFISLIFIQVILFKATWYQHLKPYWLVIILLLDHRNWKDLSKGTAILETGRVSVVGMATCLSLNIVIQRFFYRPEINN